jgi:hypothetical protein
MALVRTDADRPVLVEWIIALVWRDVESAGSPVQVRVRGVARHRAPGKFSRSFRCITYSPGLLACPKCGNPVLASSRAAENDIQFNLIEGVVIDLA